MNMKYLVFTLLVLPFIPWSWDYDRQQYLWSEYHRGGCAFENCPDYIQQLSLKTHNGLYPSQYYEKYSKEWWRSYCTYSPEKCTY